MLLHNLFAGKKQKRTTKQSKLLSDAIAEREELAQKNEHLIIELTKIRQKCDRLEKKCDEMQDKMIALCMHPSNYATYMNDKNVTDEERELKKMFSTQKVEDFDGMKELGIFNTGLPIVNQPESA